MKHRAVLASLHLGILGNSRKNTTITNRVLAEEEAEADAGHFTQHLWPKRALSDIEKLDTKIRRFFTTCTLPWLDAGARVLPATQLDINRPDNYHQTIRDFKDQRRALIETFGQNYSTYYAEAKRMLQGMFDPTHYPDTREAALERFTFTSKIEPIPDSSDFRLTWGQADLAEAKARIDSRVAEAERKATAALMQRLTAPLNRLVTQLAQQDKKIRAASLAAVREITTIAPDFDVADDPTLQVVVDRINDLLSSYPKELLDTSAASRGNAASKARAILDVMAPWVEDPEDEDDLAAALTTATAAAA